MGTADRWLDLPFLGAKMNLTINRLAKRYGNVFQLQLGSRKVVVISGQETIRKALLNNATVFAGRPDFYTYKAVKSFAFDDFSPTYRVYKKHTLKAFGQFAKVRKEKLQQVAHNAVQMLINEFKIANNQPIDPNPILRKAASKSSNSCNCFLTRNFIHGKKSQMTPNAINLGNLFGPSRNIATSSLLTSKNFP